MVSGESKYANEGDSTGDADVKTKNVLVKREAASSKDRQALSSFRYLSKRKSKRLKKNKEHQSPSETKTGIKMKLTGCEEDEVQDATTASA